MNSEPKRSANGVSRRSFLGLLGVTGIGAFLASCGDQNNTNNHVVADLPDPIGSNRNLISGPSPLPDTETAPPTPTHALPPPPVAVEPKNNYGILPRSMWSKGGPDLNRIEPMSGVRLITFHHSGDPKPFYSADFGETAQHLEYVREYHRSKNFNDIGYHFAIDRAGRVWQLRSLKYQGQHVRYNNEHNVGVVVLGNFDMQPMTQAQKDKARVFGKILRNEYRLPIARVYTHQEIVSTECPGHGMQPYMTSIRRQGLI